MQRIGFSLYVFALVSFAFFQASISYVVVFEICFVGEGAWQRLARLRSSADPDVGVDVREFCNSACSWEVYEEQRSSSSRLSREDVEGCRDALLC